MTPRVAVYERDSVRHFSELYRAKEVRAAQPSAGDDSAAPRDAQGVRAQTLLFVSSSNMCHLTRYSLPLSAHNQHN